MITQNEARCRKCGDVIVSMHRHDFKMCKCGAIGVDGGHDYIRRVGNDADIEEHSCFLETGEPPTEEGKHGDENV